MTERAATGTMDLALASVGRLRRFAPGIAACGLGLSAALAADSVAVSVAVAQGVFGQSRDNHLYFELAPNLPDPEPAPWTGEELLYGSLSTAFLLVVAAILFLRYTVGRMRRSRFTRK